MKAINSYLFSGDERKFSYLKARGFDARSGARSGGIINPTIQIIPAGAILLRTYQDPARLFGEWWFTASEMDQVIAYFGVAASKFAEGRMKGKGILQGTMAVRHEWGGLRSDHMGLAAAVRTTGPLEAFFGETDEAPDASQTKNLKPLSIIDRGGRYRFARQICLPRAADYATSFSILERDVSTDIDLIRLVQRYNAGPLPFET